MGAHVDQTQFSPEDFERFRSKLERNLEALGMLLGRPDFGRGPASIGAELEMSIVSADGQPLPIAAQVLDDLADDHFTPELNRFNLEYNSPPIDAHADALSKLEATLAAGLDRVRDVARRAGACVASIGIVPTLAREDFVKGIISDTARYRALSQEIKRSRGEAFHVHIEGDEQVSIDWDSVALEGANTSLQIHWRVPAERYAALYNAAQLASAAALAASVNSPIFLGKLLWEETRVALFPQAVEEHPTRVHVKTGTERVSFGTRWAISPFDLFEQSVRQYVPLIPILHDEDPIAALMSGETPGLYELRLHHGTVWPWNRAVFDPVDGGHLRIEFRALPAGPTALDMTANAAFLLGLTHAVAQEIDFFMQAVSFGAAHDNFFRAARYGLDASLSWPTPAGGPWRRGQHGVPPTNQRTNARHLVLELLGPARDGLIDAGFAPADAERLLDVIRERVRTGRTGATWQRAALARHEQSHDRDSALRRMLAEYLELSESGEPVHTWNLPGSAR